MKTLGAIGMKIVIALEIEINVENRYYGHYWVKRYKNKVADKVRHAYRKNLEIIHVRGAGS